MLWPTPHCASSSLAPQTVPFYTFTPSLPHFCRRPSSLLLFLFGCLLILLVNLPSNGADAFVRRPTNGLMKLCPPGGQSFATAWEITCGMRRKRRSADTDADEWTTKTAAEEPIGPTINDQADSSPSKSLWISIGDLLFNRHGPATKTAVVARKDHAMESNKLATNDHQYRAPSMTEMMQFCCRFGCSLRDLMPYCDPFGEWDS